MCDKCSRGGDEFDPNDPNVEADFLFGIPVVHKTEEVDGGHLHVIGVPVGMQLPPHVKAENERRINDILDSVDLMVGARNEDAAWLSMVVSLSSDTTADPRASAVVLATALVETARLRKTVRTLTEAQFGPQARSQTPQKPPTEGQGWEAPPPWI